MAVDISIENFALVLFRKLWIRHGLSDVKNCVTSYPEISASETECTDEILNTVYLQQVLSHFFYEQLLDIDYHEFSTSRSDFHSYFTSCCDHFSLAGLYIMEELLGTAAFIAEMGLVCASNENPVYVHSCPMSWAMHFDWNLKEKFYKSGGWAAFREYSAGYEKTSTFVMSFGRQYNVYEQIEQYLDYYFPKLMSVFSETDAKEWKRKCTALKIALNPVTDNSKGPLIDSEKFAELIRLPSLLSVLSKLPDLDFLSNIPANELSYYDTSRFRCVFLENVEKTTDNNFRPSVNDSKSNTCGRNKSKFMNFFSSEPVEESKALSSRVADVIPFPTNQNKEQTEANTETDAKSEIVPLPISCNAPIDPNSRKKTQSEGPESEAMYSKLPDNVPAPTSQSKEQTEEHSRTDYKNEIIPLSSKSNTCLASNIVSKTQSEDQPERNSMNSICTDNSDVSEQVVKTDNNDFRSSDSISNAFGRDESKFMNLFFKPDVKSKTSNIQLADNVSSQTSQSKEQTSRTDFKNKIVSLSSNTCLVSNIVVNSTMETQSESQRESKSSSSKLADIEPSPTNLSENQTKVNCGTDSTSETFSHSPNTNTCSVSNIVPTANDFVPSDLKQNGVKRENMDPDLSKASVLIQSIDQITRLVNEHLSRNDHGELTAPKFTCSTIETSDSKPNDSKQNEVKRKNKDPYLSKSAELIQSIDHVTRIVNEHLSRNDHGEITAPKSTCSTMETSDSRPKENHEANTSNSNYQVFSKLALPDDMCEVLKSPQNHEQPYASNSFENGNTSSSAISTNSIEVNNVEDGNRADPIPDNFFNQTPGEHVTEAKTPSKRRKRNKAKKNEPSHEFENPNTEADPEEDGYSTEPAPANFSNQTPREHVTQTKTPSKRRKKNKNKKNEPSHESEESEFENSSTEADPWEDGYSTEPAPANFSSQTPCDQVTQTKTLSKKRKKTKDKKNESSHESEASEFENPSTTVDPEENGYSTGPAPANFSNQTPCEQVTETKTPSKRPKNKSKINEPLIDFEPSIFENPSTRNYLDALYTQDQKREIILRMLLVLGTRLYS